MSIEDKTLRDVLWLIDCERDAAETTGGKLDAIDNIEQRIRGHWRLRRRELYPGDEEKPHPRGTGDGHEQSDGSC